MSRPKDKQTRITGFKPPITYPKYAWQVKTERYFNFDAKFESIVLPDKLETTQKWITFATRYKVSFPLQTIRPKVQKIRIVEPFCLPKDVAVGRKRKQYAKIDFVQLLNDMNIANIDIYPLPIIEKLYPNGFRAENIFSLKYFLPLDWFDNNDLDIYSEKGWLESGMIDGEQHPLPALGFVPNVPYENNDEILIENEAELILKYFDIDKNDFKVFNPNLYVWRLIAVWSYDEKTDLWRVTDLETYKSFKMHRIYFKFIAEDPVNFANRIKEAIRVRTENERIIKFETVLDTFIFQTKFPRLKQTENLIEKILLGSVSKKFMQYFQDNFIGFLRQQVRSQINKHNSRYELIRYLERQDEFKFLDVSKIKPQSFKKSYKYKPLRYDLKSKQKDLIFRSMYYCEEVVYAIAKVARECLFLESLTLFTCSAYKLLSLEEFVSAQAYCVSKHVTQIKGFWVEDIAYHVHILLRQTGKGWMDICLRDWFIFKQSKIYYLLNQIQLRMEDSLQVFLSRSIKCFTNMLCGPCKPTLDVNDDYVWDSTFIKSPFKSTTHNAVFYIAINMCENGACLSTKPEEYLPTLINLYQMSLIQCTPVPIINPRVMINLVYPKNMYLNCGDEIEKLFHSHLAYLKQSFTKAIIPLISYSRKYDQFHDLYYLEVPEYINELREENKSANALKDLIIEHKRLKKHLMDILPKTIIIGPFSVNVEPIKTFLVNKYQIIVDALLVYYTDRMREINENLLEQLTYIFNRISEKSNSIEHLYEIKDFIATVPGQLETLDERIKIMNYEYDMLEYFLYNLSDEQFGMKWQVIAYPYRILKKIGEANEQHKVEIEIFKKTQINELANYSDRLESVNEEVSQFGYVFDTNKLEENAVDAKKLWKLIIDMEKQGQILKMRQEIFELEEYSLDFILNIKSSFQPYYDLWTSCLNILKLQELCIGNPMISLDMDDIRGQLDGFLNMLKSLFMIFNEKPEIQNVASSFIDNINDFEQTVEVLSWLKNENWLLMHWQELNAKGKMEIKYSQNVNLHYCQKKGIMKHLELVREIGQRAVDQAEEIRAAFEAEERRKREEEERILQKKMARKCRRDIL